MVETPEATGITINGEIFGPDDYLTADNLAARWKKHTKTLANMRTAGNGPVYMRTGKKGSAVRYQVRDVLHYEDFRKSRSTSEEFERGGI